MPARRVARRDNGAHLTLGDYLRSRRDEVRSGRSARPASGGAGGDGREACAIQPLAGGKRLRPLLSHGGRRRPPGPRTRGGSHAGRLPIEMIHTYSLIPRRPAGDDNDTMRRGRPTLHVVYGARLPSSRRRPAGRGVRAARPGAGRRGPAAIGRTEAGRHRRIAARLAHRDGAGSHRSAGRGRARGREAHSTPPASRHARAQDRALIRASRGRGDHAGASPRLSTPVDRYAGRLASRSRSSDDVLDVEGEAGAREDRRKGRAAASPPTRACSAYRLEADGAGGLRRGVAALAGAGLDTEPAAEIRPVVVSRTS